MAILSQGQVVLLRAALARGMAFDLGTAGNGDGSGSGGISGGSGPPAAPPFNQNAGAIYTDFDTGIMYSWNFVTKAWI